MAKKKPEDIIADAKKCLSNYEDREASNIKRAEEAIRFRALEQWPVDIKNDRENPNQPGGSRPCPVLDKTNQYVRQIINEERQNRAAIKIRPVDKQADTKVAEVFTGIIRHIEDASEAIQAYTTAGEHAIDGGFGYWRIIADYCDDMSFEQDIRIKRIHNRFSVALGPHTEPDGADAKEAVVWEDVPREDFKAEYPNAKEVGFEDGDGWSDRDTIRVAEYMCIKPKPIKIHQLDTGEVVTDAQLKEIWEKAADMGIMPPEPIASRDTVKKTVYWYKMTREEILDERELIGSYIPVVKVTGNELTMPDGTIRTSGAIEAMMDPQLLHNYAHAGFIENVALAPRAPWVAADEAVEGYEEDYEMANRQPIALLKFKQFDSAGTPLPPPQRTPPPGISPGWQQMLMNTEHGIEASVGMYGPSVGAKSQERSGIALQEQKVQGMVGNFHFPDNLARSIRHTGRILLEWIPKIYDTERVARILGEDNEAEMINLNPSQETAVAPEFDQYGNEIGTIYNLNVGKYDVTVTTGPSYTAKRQEAADQQLQVIQARPELLDVIGDIAFENMDTPGSDQIAERLKTLLPPPVQELIASKDKKPLDPKVRMAMQQVKQAQEQLNQQAEALKQAEMDVREQIAQLEEDKAETQSERFRLESAKKVLNSEQRAAMSKLELSGRKLADDIDEIVRPLIENINEDADIAKIQEALSQVAAVTNQATERMAQMTQDAMRNVAELA